MDNFLDSKLKKNNIVSLMYVCIILCVFPLVFHNYYFDILIFKYNFYYKVTLIYISIIVINNIIYLLNKKNKITFKNLSVSEISILFFVLIAIISTLQSDFVYESFWGNEGRYAGCFTLLLYGISALFIIRYLNFKNWILNLFLFSGVLACCFGITDYFKLDILGFKVNIESTQYNMFMSTIGNINTYTAYVAMVMGVSAVLFMDSDRLWNAILYYICMVISFLAMVMGLSDNAYLAIGAMFAFLPLWIFRDRKGIKRYIISLTTFIYVIAFVAFINKIMPNHVLQMGGILEFLLYFKKSGIIVISATIICIIVCIYDFSNKESSIYNNKIRLTWLIFLLFILGSTAFVLFDCNINMNKERYGKLANYLSLNDEWGTHRGYVWRIGIECYNKLPVIHKIFGYGPDTFGLLVLHKSAEMKARYNEYFDSAHNEYLQYILTIGPLGLLSYLIFLIASCKQMIKRGIDNPYIIAILFAVICYSAQAVVNISLPIVTPLLFVFIAVGLTGSRKLDISRSENKNDKL